MITAAWDGRRHPPERLLEGGSRSRGAPGPQVNPGVYNLGPFVHYGLLRTLEDGYGIHNYLGHAIDFGVQPIYPIWK